MAEKTVEIVVSYYVNCIEHDICISEEIVVVGQDEAGFYFYQSRATEVCWKERRAVSARLGVNCGF